MFPSLKVSSLLSTTYRNDHILDILTGRIPRLFTSILELICNQLFHCKVGLIIQVKEGCAAIRIGDHIVDETVAIFDTMLVVIGFANKVLEVGKSRLWETTGLCMYVYVSTWKNVEPVNARHLPKQANLIHRHADLHAR